MSMPLSGVLRHGTVAEFTESAKRQLVELNQFRIFSFLSHQVLKQRADDGKGMMIGGNVPGCDRPYSKEEFFQLLASFDEKFIRKMVLLQVVDLFEHWLFRVLRAILAHPHRVFRKTQINAKTVLEATSLEDLKLKVIDNELDGLRHESPKEWFDYFKNQLNVERPDRETSGRLREMKATRDVWVHNDGYANELYFQKTGSYARVEPILNARLDISNEYFHETWNLVADFMDDFGQVLSKKFDSHILSYYE